VKLVAYIITYLISYLFGSFAFPQIVGSIRMITKGFRVPYIFTLILWLAICAGVTLLVYLHLSEYFTIYLVALIIPFALTIRTKNIE
jgi:hypothetical protein